MSTPSGKPKCPNHLVPLTDCKNSKGICPISGYVFEYDENHAEKTKKLRLNALGQYEEVSDWKVTGEESEDEE